MNKASDTKTYRIHASALPAGCVFIILGFVVAVSAFSSPEPTLQASGGLITMFAGIPFFLIWKNLRIISSPAGIQATSWLGKTVFRARWDETTLLEEGGFEPRAKFWRLYAGSQMLELRQGVQSAEEIVEEIRLKVPGLPYVIR